MPYRMRSLCGTFMPGSIVTDEDVKRSGGDLDFWKRIGAVEEMTEGEAKAELDMTDGAKKARIERRLRDHSLRTGRAPTPQETDRIINDVHAGRPDSSTVRGPIQATQPPPGRQLSEAEANELQRQRQAAAAEDQRNRQAVDAENQRRAAADRQAEQQRQQQQAAEQQRQVAADAAAKAKLDAENKNKGSGNK